MIIDPLIINWIDSYPTGCMDNLTAIEHNANMHNPTVGIIKKSEITWLYFRQEIDCFSLFCLLRSIPFDRYT